MDPGHFSNSLGSFGVHAVLGNVLKQPIKKFMIVKFFEYYHNTYGVYASQEQSNIDVSYHMYESKY